MEHIHVVVDLFKMIRDVAKDFIFFLCRLISPLDELLEISRPPINCILLPVSQRNRFQKPGHIKTSSVQSICQKKKKERCDLNVLLKL